MRDHEPVPAPPTALTEDDLQRLRAALQAGKRPRVYLCDAVPSLGVAAASSAQVLAVDGSTVTVRPTGVGDDVPFEAGELYPSKAAAIAAASAPPPRRTRRKPTTPAATRVSVTITGTAAGVWTVQSAHGSRKQGAPAPVEVEAVAKAVAALGDARAVTAVEAVRDHAKQAAAARVAELSAELRRAEAALRALGGR